MLGHDSLACISSRFSTVIHVAASIKETITDLMSHSQFHCKSLTLIRAWLSPRDKHMTTGRINQVSLLVCGVWRLPGSAERQKSFEKWHFEHPERGGGAKNFGHSPPIPQPPKTHPPHALLLTTQVKYSFDKKQTTHISAPRSSLLALSQPQFVSAPVFFKRITEPAGASSDPPCPTPRVSRPRPAPA